MNQRRAAAATLFVLGGLALLLFERGGDPAVVGETAPTVEAVEAQPAPPQSESRAAAEPLAAAAVAAEERREEPPRPEPRPAGAPQPPALAIADGEPRRAPIPGPATASAGTGGAPEQPAADESRASLSKDEVRAAVRAVLPRVKECYQAALGRDPSLAGRVLVRFEIEARDGKGKVVSGEVPDSETGSPFFEACVLERVAGAEFPAPAGQGKVTVTYPFAFDPGGGFGGGAQ